jgi:hypothetical protein
MDQYFSIIGLHNRSQYFIGAKVYEKGLKENYNPGKVIFNFTYEKIFIPEPTTLKPTTLQTVPTTFDYSTTEEFSTLANKEPANNTIPNENSGNMWYLIGAAGILLLTIIVGTWCYYRNRSVPDKKRLNFSGIEKLN